jgi:hypothetical protein
VSEIGHGCGRINQEFALIADFETELATAVRCLTDDFEACIAHLRCRLPIAGRSERRNLLERLSESVGT